MHTAFVVLAIFAIAFQSLLLFLAFFGPDLPYRIKEAPKAALGSDYFLDLLAALTDAEVHRGNQIEVLTNGNCFYEAELATIRAAQYTINLEAYIFHRGEIAKRFADALAERARAGVQVKVILDTLAASVRSAAISGICSRRADGSNGITRCDSIYCRRSTTAPIANCWSWMEKLPLLVARAFRICGTKIAKSTRAGATRWYASKGRWWPAYNRFSLRTGCKSQARFSPTTTSSSFRLATAARLAWL